MIQAQEQKTILKINQTILSNAFRANSTLFNALVLSMQEHIRGINCEVEIYIEKFDGENKSGEETTHLFDAINMLNEWIKTTYLMHPSN